MNILQRIIAQAQRHELIMEEKPLCVYIGTEDMVELQKVLDEQGYYSNRDTTKQERLNVGGLDVYVIDTPRHMNIA